MKATISNKVSVIGMLHIVEVRMVDRASGEKIKQKLLMVGCQASDIESKLRWVFDRAKYSEMSISSIEKVREKIHTLSTTFTQERVSDDAIVKVDEGSKDAGSVTAEKEKYDPNLYAVGLSTTVLAADEDHALRKIGRALIERTTSIKSGGPELSDDSFLTVERIPKGSGFSRARDMDNEANSATFVSGGAPGLGKR